MKTRKPVLSLLRSIHYMATWRAGRVHVLASDEEIEEVCSDLILPTEPQWTRDFAARCIVRALAKERDLIRAFSL